jgi:glycine cleavage system H protein
VFACKISRAKVYFYLRTSIPESKTRWIMNTPDNLKYSKEHEWISMTGEQTEDGNAIALIGITDFAQGELGELVYVEVDTVGEDVARDDVFGTLEAVKTTSDLFMPVSGKVMEFNDELNEDEGDNPGIINSDPYGAGWIVKIAITQLDELSDLMDAAGYSALIG